MTQYMMMLEVDGNQVEFLGMNFNEVTNKIRDVLESRGFVFKSYGTYLGKVGINAVDCVLAIEDLMYLVDGSSLFIKKVDMYRISETTNMNRLIPPNRHVQE